ncbi:3937_t:CDS:2 [Gigaspora rosea]|nr:3937_t:CDS:2 [Gigaspora rosea]
MRMIDAKKKHIQIVVTFLTRLFRAPTVFIWGRNASGRGQHHQEVASSGLHTIQYKSHWEIRQSPSWSKPPYRYTEIRSTDEKKLKPNVCDECLPTKEKCNEGRKVLDVFDKNGIILEKYIFGDLNKKIEIRKPQKRKIATEDDTISPDLFMKASQLRALEPGAQHENLKPKIMVTTSKWKPEDFLIPRYREMEPHRITDQSRNQDHSLPKRVSAIPKIRTAIVRKRSNPRQRDNIHQEIQIMGQEHDNSLGINLTIDHFRFDYFNKKIPKSNYADAIIEEDYGIGPSRTRSNSINIEFDSQTAYSDNLSEGSFNSISRDVSRLDMDIDT